MYFKIIACCGALQTGNLPGVVFSVNQRQGAVLYGPTEKRARIYFNGEQSQIGSQIAWMRKLLYQLQELSKFYPRF